MARLAIPAYVESAIRLESAAPVPVFIERLQRAVQLALMVGRGDPALLGSVTSEIEKFIDKHAKADLPNWNKPAAEEEYRVGSVLCAWTPSEIHSVKNLVSHPSKIAPGLALTKVFPSSPSLHVARAFARTPMKPKYLTLTDPLYRYICAHRSNTSDPVLDALRDETELLGEAPANMQISRDQGSFMTLLVGAMGVKSAIEVGTFTGYSSICIARGLPKDGRLLCVDASDEWTATARKYWAQAGVADKIELRLGPAIPILQKLEPDLVFDFAFIDADKTEYDAYYELILPRLRQNGLIMFDNMLWGGALGSGPVDQPTGRAIDALNRKLAQDRRVEAVLLSMADGIQLCRKR